MAPKNAAQSNATEAMDAIETALAMIEDEHDIELQPNPLDIAHKAQVAAKIAKLLAYNALYAKAIRAFDGKLPVNASLFIAAHAYARSAVGDPREFAL